MILVSVISTVLNEEKTIRSFLDSILNQTFSPDEIIIVDGGSKDKTFDILVEYSKKHSNLKVYRMENSNIAQGRNHAIRKAKGLIIVTADAGCEYEKNYIKKMVLPLLKYMINYYKEFRLKKEDILHYIKRKGISIEELEKEEEAEFVQGRYYPKSENKFQYFAGFMLVKKNQFRIPSRTSSRATAFFRYVWEEVEGYPETFVAGEDTRFHLEILNKGYKWVAKDTKVYWDMPNNIKEFYKKFEKYAIGDVLQGNIFRYKKLFLLFTGYIISILILIYSLVFNLRLFVFLLVIIVLYLTIFGIIYVFKTKNLYALFYIPILEFLRRFAYFVGFIKGFLRKCIK